MKHAHTVQQHASDTSQPSHQSDWLSRFLADPPEPLTEEELAWLNFTDQETLWHESESWDDDCA